MEADDHVDDQRMRLRYDGTCRLCGTQLPSGAQAVYEQATKTVRCVECPTEVMTVGLSGEPEPSAPVIAPAAADPGVAGSSARREYERRRAKDEARLRQRWGKLGGIAGMMSDEKHSTKAWAVGAVGEERLGARLDTLVSESVAILHDRRIPGTRANIDHIAVTTAGVWVVDAKRYKGRPELRVEGGILRPRVERVVVGRRDCTALVDGVLKQVKLVRQVVGDVPVTGSLCFVEAEWPLIGAAFATRGVHVLWPKRLAKLVREAAGPVDVASVRHALASHFPAA